MSNETYQCVAFEVPEDGPIVEAISAQNVEYLWTEGVPESPEEFLLRVRCEAQKFQSGATKTGPNDEDRQTRQKPTYVTRMADIEKRAAQTTPYVGKCWQEDLLRYFIATREWAHAQLLTSKSSKSAVTFADLSEREPSVDDFSSQESVWSVIEWLSEKTSECSNFEHADSVEEGETVEESQEEDETVEKSDEVTGCQTGLSDKDLRWAFAALVMLDELAACDSDIAYALQTIRRQCCKQTVRTSLSVDANISEYDGAELQGALVTIITVISCFFGQK